MISSFTEVSSPPALPRNIPRPIFILNGSFGSGCRWISSSIGHSVVENH